MSVVTLRSVVNGRLMSMWDGQYDGTAAVRCNRDAVGGGEQFEIAELEAIVTAIVQKLLPPQPVPPQPIPPDPKPEPPPSKHVPVGPPTVEQLSKVVYATADEFPHLVKVFDTDAEALAAADELLQRIIWHLGLAGFVNVARQRNPSGLISSDKLCVTLQDWQWHAFDVMSLGYAGHATKMQVIEIGGANPVESKGIAD